MRDEDEDVRYKAAYALGQVGSDSDEAVAALIVALKDTDHDVVTQARAALAKSGLRAVAPLRKALTQRPIAYQAAYALSRLARAKDEQTAKAAILAVPDLLARLRRAETADECATVLPAFGPKALPALRAAIKDADPGLRCGLAHEVGEIGVSAMRQGDAAGVRQAIEILIAVLPDRDVDVRLTAFLDLRNLASLEAGPARRAIETAFADDWFEFSYAAYEAIQHRYQEPDDMDDLLDKRIAAAKGDHQLRLACLLPRRHRALLVKNLRHRDPALRCAARAA